MGDLHTEREGAFDDKGSAATYASKTKREERSLTGRDSREEKRRTVKEKVRRDIEDKRQKEN